MSESRLVLASTGRAGDASYLAAADLAEIATTLDVPYRLVGGNAVTLLVAVHGVDHLVPARETTEAILLLAGTAFLWLFFAAIPLVGWVIAPLALIVLFVVAAVGSAEAARQYNARWFPPSRG